MSGILCPLFYYPLTSVPCFCLGLIPLSRSSSSFFLFQVFTLSPPAMPAGH